MKVFYWLEILFFRIASYTYLFYTPLHKHTRVCLQERCLTSSVDIEIIFIKLFGEYIIKTNEEKYLYSVRVFPNSEAQWLIDYYIKLPYG